jgi:hypothetical protein
MIKFIEASREFQDMVMGYVDSGMSLKEAEKKANEDMKRAMLGTK